MRVALSGGQEQPHARCRRPEAAGTRWPTNHAAEATRHRDPERRGRHHPPRHLTQRQLIKIKDGRPRTRVAVTSFQRGALLGALIGSGDGLAGKTGQRGSGFAFHEQWHEIAHRRGGVALVDVIDVLHHCGVVDFGKVLPQDGEDLDQRPVLGIRYLTFSFRIVSHTAIQAASQRFGQSNARLKRGIPRSLVRGRVASGNVHCGVRAPSRRVAARRGKSWPGVPPMIQYLSFTY